MPTSKTRVPTNSLAGGLLVAGLLTKDWKTDVWAGMTFWAEQEFPAHTRDPIRTMAVVSFKGTPCSAYR